MEWNNGTIFRVYVAGSDPTLSCRVNISQQELNNKVYIGVENFIMRPSIINAQRRDFWSDTSFIQLQSFNLPPYIDFSTYTNVLNRNTGNSNIFARLPLIVVPSVEDSAAIIPIIYGLDRVYDKSALLYEMINNPNALSNGTLKIRVLDQDGTIIPTNYIDAIYFTIVIYKPSEKYS